MKKQKNIRLSEASLGKLADLGQRYGTETTAMEIAIDRLHREEIKVIWFRCKCGKAFSNEVEIDEATVSELPHGKAIRYYFEGGTVLYPPGGGTHTATCWECAEP